MASARDDERPSLDALAAVAHEAVACARAIFQRWLSDGADPPDEWTLAPSSVCLARVLDALAMRDHATLGAEPIVSERSFRRILAGEAARAAERLIPGLALRAIEHEPVARDVYDVDAAADVLERALQDVCASWDAYVGVVNASGISRAHALRATVRALLPDLAIRRAALLAKTGGSRLGQSPFFAERPFRAAVDHLLRQIGARKDDLHEHIPSRSLDDWRGDKPPSDASIHRLAGAFVRLREARQAGPTWDKHEVRAYLRLARGAHVLRRALDEAIGPEAVLDLVRALDHLTELALAGLQGEAIENAALFAIATAHWAEADELMRSQAGWHAPTRDGLEAARAEGINHPMAWAAVELATGVLLEDRRLETGAILRAIALEAMVWSGASSVPGGAVIAGMQGAIEDLQLREDLRAAAAAGWRARALDWLAKVFVLEFAGELDPTQREKMHDVIDSILTLETPRRDASP